MIGPAQVRMARAGLRWTLIDLGKKSGVNPNTINRFEMGVGINSKKLRQIEAALLKAGVTFSEHGNQLTVTITSRER
jgi:transcriptional regulator with XRE-family HTH domain